MSLNNLPIVARACWAAFSAVSTAESRALVLFFSEAHTELSGLSIILSSTFLTSSVYRCKVWMAVLYSFTANCAAWSTDLCKSINVDGSGSGFAGVNLTSADGFSSAGFVGVATAAAVAATAGVGVGLDASLWGLAGVDGGGAVSVGKGGAADEVDGLFEVGACAGADVTGAATDGAMDFTNIIKQTWLYSRKIGNILDSFTHVSRELAFLLLCCHRRNRSQYP